MFVALLDHPQFSQDFNEQVLILSMRSAPACANFNDRFGNSPRMCSYRSVYFMSIWTLIWRRTLLIV